MALDPTVAASFRVAGTAHIGVTDQPLFVLYGDISMGAIRPGMIVRVPFNSAVAMEAPIHSVELIDGTKSGSHIALTIVIENDDDRQLWQSLGLKGETLAVIEREARAI